MASRGSAGPAPETGRGPRPGPFPVDPFGSHDDIFPPDRGDAAGAATPPAAARAAGPGRARAGAAPAPAAEAAAGADTGSACARSAARRGGVAVRRHRDERRRAARPGRPRRAALLTSLVDDEVALAKAYRSQGQTLDAILQLTEAEKACTALGLDDTLGEVKALLGELQI